MLKLGLSAPLFILLLFCFGFFTHAQIYSPDSRENDCVKSLEGWMASYKGQTQQGVDYDLYAIKNKKYWIFLVQDDQDNLYSFTKRQKGFLAFIFRANKKDQIKDQPQAFTNGLCSIVGEDFFKEKKKTKSVGDLNLYGYYKLNGKGRRMYKNLSTYPRMQEEEGTKKRQNKDASPIFMDLSNVPETSEPIPDTIPGYDVKKDTANIDSLLKKEQHADELKSDIQAKEGSSEQKEDDKALENVKKIHDDTKEAIKTADDFTDDVLKTGNDISRGVEKIERAPADIGKRIDQKIDKGKNIIDD